MITNQYLQEFLNEVLPDRNTTYMYDVLRRRMDNLHFDVNHLVVLYYTTNIPINDPLLDQVWEFDEWHHQERLATIHSGQIWIYGFEDEYNAVIFKLSQP